jgi:YVTN family beta-propeller protein
MHEHPRFPSVSRALLHSALAVICMSADAQGTHEPPKPGIPAVKRAMSELHPLATFHAQGMPDWMAVTPDSVWVTSSRAGVITQLDAKTNQVGRTISIAKPCSGLLFAFGSLWIPSCGDHTLVRADPVSGSILARVAAGPADSEGGITGGAGSVWLVTDSKGALTRIDAGTNQVQARITIPSGSYNPFFADGFVWVSSHDHDALIKVDPAANKVIATIPVGKGPRFLTYGAGSVWTLNQGDGTVSRVDTASSRLSATINAGIPGTGGEIAFGFDAVWATVMGFPITRIDPATNKVSAQWAGAGGDSIRTGFGSLWLTNLMTGTIWRFAPPGH